MLPWPWRWPLGTRRGCRIGSPLVLPWPLPLGAGGGCCVGNSLVLPGAWPLGHSRGQRRCGAGPFPVHNPLQLRRERPLRVLGGNNHKLRAGRARARSQRGRGTKDSALSHPQSCIRKDRSSIIQMPAKLTSKEAGSSVEEPLGRLTLSWGRRGSESGGWKSTLPWRMTPQMMA